MDTQSAIAAYSVNAFCKAFCLGRTRTYEEINAGRLKTIKCGRRTLITKIAAENWVALLEQKTATEAQQ